ncbi:MAG TPA: anti-sigma factor [Silvibacterium sp.]|nr:anti-sigma factor [Silvibacterium sp.]
MSGTQHISQEDLALYSMQALTPAENAEVRAHLDSCAACRAALADVLADVALVGLSVPQQPIPEGGRQRFLATMRNTPQSASSTATTTTRRSDSTPPPRGSSLGWLAGLGWLAAAVAIAFAFYFGVHRSALQRQLDRQSGQVAQLSAENQQLSEEAQELHKLMNALTSPDAKQVTLTETRRPAQPAGHVTYMAKSGALLLVASNLHPLPQNKTYELWLIPANGKAPVPAGLFRPDASGSASVVMPPMLEGMQAKAFGVTVEIAQGSPTPTLPIVMSGQ